MLHGLRLHAEVRVGSAAENALLGSLATTRLTSTTELPRPRDRDNNVRDGSGSGRPNLMFEGPLTTEHSNAKDCGMVTGQGDDTSRSLPSSDPSSIHDGRSSTGGEHAL